MCGIAAFFAKTPRREKELGALFAPMMGCLSGRGPDSAGFALYRDPAPAGAVKVVLYSSSPSAWEALRAGIGDSVGLVHDFRVIQTHCVITVATSENRLLQWLRRERTDLTVMSIGSTIEIYKEIGLPCAVMERFNLSAAQGSHAIGHTRMATESAVTTAGSHPFSSGLDLCLVHNGSLSNHNRLRRNLQREGIAFATDNDSEVAAGYLTWRLRQGEDLTMALQGALRDLDGFYTFAIGTRDGFAVLRDPIACKPAIIAETEDYVAMASEYRSLAHLPQIEKAQLWEPEPARVYTWSKAEQAVQSCAA
jgi:methylamine---glutamate N-methyltransferase subunit A